MRTDVYEVEDERHKAYVKLTINMLHCAEKVEEIVVKPAEGEETDEDRSLFPQLSCLTPTHQPKLTIFSQGKFTKSSVPPIRFGILWPKNIWEMEQLWQVYAYPMKLLPDFQSSAVEADHKLSNLLVSILECANSVKLPDRQLKSLQVLSANVIGSRFPNLTKLSLYFMKILRKLLKLRILKIKDFKNQVPGRLHVLNGSSNAESATFVIHGNCKLKTLPDKLWSLIGLEKVELSGWLLSLKELVFKSEFQSGQCTNYL
ncbi:hypothetical protein FNV43_RR00047 [Rhamnella rubrinervis]|uniref:Uncharacterized protein n=1 Tax=Rhamnella rubrinervis TaxID=2594499 RepID=A0A8K0MR23_9ROSA|nr:hypothetical protein FNV43_RR00047 [Rhamnella rubrinervis]